MGDLFAVFITSELKEPNPKSREELGCEGEVRNVLGRVLIRLDCSLDEKYEVLEEKTHPFYYVTDGGVRWRFI